MSLKSSSSIRNNHPTRSGGPLALNVPAGTILTAARITANELYVNSSVSPIMGYQQPVLSDRSLSYEYLSYLVEYAPQKISKEVSNSG